VKATEIEEGRSGAVGRIKEGVNGEDYAQGDERSSVEVSENKKPNYANPNKPFRKKIIGNEEKNKEKKIWSCIPI